MSNFLKHGTDGILTAIANFMVFLFRKPLTLIFDMLVFGINIHIDYLILIKKRIYILFFQFKL